MNITGIISTLVKLVETNGNGKRKKEIVLKILKDILLESKIPLFFLTDKILSEMIDAIVSILFPKPKL
jgi:hypothetical protein